MPSWISLNQATVRRETNRNSNRDFLIDAYNVLCKDKGNALLSQYYHLRVNCLLDTDRDDLNFINKLSAHNTKCTRCGSLRQPRIKGRRHANRSKDRKYCRYLRGLAGEYCDKCNSKTVHKLESKQAVSDRLKSKQQVTPKDQEANVPAQQSKPTKANTSKAKPKQQPAQQTPSAPQQQPPANTRPAYSKRLRLQAKQPPPAPVQKPQFSSRLRAFDCLLRK